MTRRAALAALICCGAAAVSAGCAPTIHLEPQPAANDASCADVSVRLPDTVGGLERIWTDAQATAAWGDDDGAAVIFSCGADTPTPSTLQCVSIGGVDWIVDETDQPKLLLTAYGRAPSAEVYVDTTRVSSNDVLDAVGNATLNLEKTGECTTPDEATQVEEDAPTTSGGAG